MQSPESSHEMRERERFCSKIALIVATDPIPTSFEVAIEMVVADMHPSVSFKSTLAQQPHLPTECLYQQASCWRFEVRDIAGKHRRPSEWNTALVWALAWQCLLMVQHASTQDLSVGNDFMNLECERLPADHCAFAVGAGGFRCVLETAVHVDGSIAYECQTLRLELQPGSDANRYGLQLGSDGNPFFHSAYIETDECLKACGLQRLTVGVSTDDILYNSGLLERLCSPNCRQRCANIIDHYGIIMAEAGENLTKVCEGLMEYLQSEREQAKQPAIKTGERKGNQKLYEQAPGPSSYNF